MAEGGVALRPTWRRFGEAGPEAVIPLHRMAEVSRKFGGGGGGSVSVNIGSIGGGLADLSAQDFGRLVGEAVTSQVERDGGVRGTIRRTASGGLYT